MGPGARLAAGGSAKDFVTENLSHECQPLEKDGHVIRSSREREDKGFKRSGFPASNSCFSADTIINTFDDPKYSFWKQSC